MKKIIISLFLIFLGVIAFFVAVNINRIGKENLYVEVIEPTKIEEDRLNSGGVVNRYLYKQTAFDKKGNPVELEFSAGKELRKGAYLMLYTKKGTEVTSYKELEWGEIPSKAQTALENYYGGV